MRQAAVDGTLCFMVGASEEIFARVRPLLAHMGTDILHCGAVGSGQVVKILNNMVLIQNVHALAGALCAARAHNVSGEVLFDALSKGSADSLALRRQGMKHLLTGDFPERTFSSRYARKDVGLAEQLFADASIDTALLKATADLLEAACGAGLADAYYPAFVSLLARPKDAEAQAEATLH
jgi:3-hydroxyisobutyrate dehydrogenase-like beta-hydroxyacid dehydrogenase